MRAAQAAVFAGMPLGRDSRKTPLLAALSTAAYARRLRRRRPAFREWPTKGKTCFNGTSVDREPASKGIPFNIYQPPATGAQSAGGDKGNVTQAATSFAFGANQGKKAQTPQTQCRGQSAYLGCAEEALGRAKEVCEVAPVGAFQRGNMGRWSSKNRGQSGCRIGEALVDSKSRACDARANKALPRRFGGRMRGIRRESDAVVGGPRGRLCLRRRIP